MLSSCPGQPNRAGNKCQPNLIRVASDLVRKGPQATPDCFQFEFPYAIPRSVCYASKCIMAREMPTKHVHRYQARGHIHVAQAQHITSSDYTVAPELFQIS